MSENGEIYSAGKNFTLPPALTAWTNSTSVNYIWNVNVNVNVNQKIGDEGNQRKGWPFQHVIHVETLSVTLDFTGNPAHVGYRRSAQTPRPPPALTVEVLPASSPSSTNTNTTSMLWVSSWEFLEDQIGFSSWILHRILDFRESNFLLVGARSGRSYSLDVHIGIDLIAPPPPPPPSSSSSSSS